MRTFRFFSGIILSVLGIYVCSYLDNAALILELNPIYIFLLFLNLVLIFLSVFDLFRVKFRLLHSILGTIFISIAAFILIFISSSQVDFYFYIVNLNLLINLSIFIHILFLRQTMQNLTITQLLNVPLTHQLLKSGIKKVLTTYAIVIIAIILLGTVSSV